MNGLLSRILVAVDDSDPSHRGVEVAVQLAAQYGGKLTCMHAVDWVGPVSQLESGLSITDPTDLVEALRTQGKALLAEASAVAKAAGVTCEERLVEDRPIEAILSAAKEIGATVIVIGTHGRKGLQRLVLGSVAEGVLRTSEVPVVAVPPPGASS